MRFLHQRGMHLSVIGIRIKYRTQVRDMMNLLTSPLSTMLNCSTMKKDSVLGYTINALRASLMIFGEMEQFTENSF